MNVRTFALGLAASAVVFVPLYAALDRWTDLGWLAMFISIFAAIVVRQAVERWLGDRENW